ncbi:ABC transporter permease subunit [Pseudonocardia sichuanensis]|uniref:Peptide/nickel transport system permease protein n=1 Tax=Pseudonocardia kunmingensis TaxID=630975 RepID=A0A543D9Z1_9PSEU|nr:ABC transporter permease subunit [Pseudonocardia kunmingensis]TQM06105.1 peptide/nickel transport system permease protein [Pseudonocardia kunmingensis]
MIRRDAVVVGASRVLAAGAVVFLIGILPWLSLRSPELAILRARSAEQEATPEALASIREQLGLDAGTLVLFGRWIGGLLSGDPGTSWVSGRPVLPGMLAALGVSLTLMAFALVVAVVVAVLLALPSVLRGLSGTAGRTSGWAAAACTALPEFLLAAVLLVVGAVWLGWFPPYGWEGVHYAVLPALALGLPAGGLVGRLFADGVAATFSEPWLGTWQVAGFSRARIVAAVARRTLPALLPQVGLVLVGLTGGAVAVEQVFAIPGLGRATLGAAAALDLPALQLGVLMLLAVAEVAGTAAALVGRALLGGALRTGDVPVPAPVTALGRRWWMVPVGAAALLAGVVGAGLLRDPYTSAHARLAPPSWALPFGADASGRDLLARAAHGALLTIGTALAVVLLSLAIGVLIGLFPRLSTGPVEVTNAAPPVIAGIVVAAVIGPSAVGAAIAVAIVSWAPLAAHTAALVAEARAQPHVRILPVLGVGPVRLLTRHVLPAVAGPLVRHAMLRLPGVVLALAALGFLGLGPQPPSPEWGQLLADGLPYVERAPWAVLAPTAVLVLTSVLAVALSGLAGRTVRLGGSARSTRLGPLRDRTAPVGPPPSRPAGSGAGPSDVTARPE